LGECIGSGIGSWGCQGSADQESGREGGKTHVECYVKSALTEASSEDALMQGEARMAFSPALLEPLTRATTAPSPLHRHCSIPWNADARLRITMRVGQGDKVALQGPKRGRPATNSSPRGLRTGIVPASICPGLALVSFKFTLLRETSVG
jgi:hypothetical protein